MSETRMPAAFIGHGSPMNTLDSNRFTNAWSELGASLPMPSAVLAISAHWYTNGTGVTAMAMPKTIHDFSGFPQELFDYEYPAKGSPELAEQTARLVESATGKQVVRDRQWGLDHGTWSVLAHVFPAANVPVFQLSIDARTSVAHRLEIGAALAPLRDAGVFVMASGNVVHNLGKILWHEPNGAHPWNTDFDRAAVELMTKRPSDIGELEKHPAYALAAPTPDHLVPLDYIAGLAVQAGATAEVFNEGPTMGSLSMTSFLVR